MSGFVRAFAIALLFVGMGTVAQAQPWHVVKTQWTEADEQGFAEFVRAIGTRLVNGQSLSESEVGLGDEITILAAGTAKAVGTGAGLLVSTPLSVIDPATRRNLGSQADDFAGQLGARAQANGTQESPGAELLTPAADTKSAKP